MGDDNLEYLLGRLGGKDRDEEYSHLWSDYLRDWLVCLASALEYLHAEGIRHQDIKPSNIVYKGPQRLFTDFGSSQTFELGHTTSTSSPAQSAPMYGAPEVTVAPGRHGRQTDIFALGCVFINMMSIIGGRRVVDLQEHIHNHNPERRCIYATAVSRFDAWFADCLTDPVSELYTSCVRHMLRMQRNKRHSAGRVVSDLLEYGLGDGECECLSHRRGDQFLDSGNDAS